MVRGAQISPDVRLIILRMKASGAQNSDITMWTGVSERSIQRIVQVYLTSGVWGVKERKQRLGKVDAAVIEDLLIYVARNPDKQLPDYRQYLATIHNIDVCESTISRALHTSGYTLKTVTKAAKERNWEKRAAFLMEITQYKPNEMVFIDESSFDKRTSNRVRTWSRVGVRIVRPSYFFRGERYSILPALSLEDGIFHLNIVNGSFNQVSFHTFIEELLDRMTPYNPVTHPSKSVIVLDNCSIHKNPETLALIIQRRMRYVFLPPYSPDYNPIELAFSSMKAWFRKNNEAVAAVWDTDLEARLFLIRMAYTATPEKARGWFRKCNYDVD